MKVVSRAYNNFELNTQTKSGIIKSSNENRLLGEIVYYNNIPENLQIFFPRILNYSIESSYKIELEYYAYNNLGIAMINNNYDLSFWDNVFDFIFNYINYYKKEINIKYNKKDAYDMFVTKTVVEYDNLFKKFEFFNNLKYEKEFIYNGKVLKPFNTIWEPIKKYIIENFYNDKFYFIHGDLCFSNILYGVNTITDDVILKFIDPRGIFGNTKFYGDFYYDLAKLSHSTNGGYEHFIYDKFNIITKNNEFELTFDNKSQTMNDLFTKRVKQYGYDEIKIKLIEGLIFIGMCARHYDSIDRQKAMFITGLNILNDIYEEI